MSATKIEWAEHSWNPIVGCSIVSPGCTNCYAMRQAARLHDHPGSHYEGTTRRVNGNAVWTGKVALAPDSILLAPLKRKKPTTWFVNSMGDLFHESVPDEWIDRVFAVMALCPQHRFQVLTKRAKGMREYMQSPLRKRTIAGAVMSVSDAKAREGGHAARITMADFDAAFKDDKPFANVWLGISAEDQANWDERKMDLAHTPAAIRFASFEPLLGPIEQPDIGEFIDWAIVGGESGRGARPMHPDWARSIRDQCEAAGVPFFFKQHGEWIGVPDLRRLSGGCGPGFGAFDHHRYDQEHEAIRVGKKAAGRLLDGNLYDGMPG